MSCENTTNTEKTCGPSNCQTNCKNHGDYSYIIIIVLYILLAIILGACLNY